MGVAAGSYEPVRASIYRPNRTKTAAGEPTTKAGQLFICKRHIRFKTMSAADDFVQLKQTAATFLTIWMHKDKLTLTIDDSCWIVHRGRRYGIVAPVVLEYIQDEVGFKVKWTQG